MYPVIKNESGGRGLVDGEEAVLSNNLPNV